MDNNPNLFVGFSQGTGFIAWAIQLFTGRGVNHAFLCWQDEHLGWVVLGANENGVTLDTWEQFTRTRTVPALFRPKDGMPTLWAGLVSLRNKLNEKYSLSGLVGMGVVELARAYGHEIPNPFAKDGHTFCSQFCADVVRRAGYPVLGNLVSTSIDPHEMMHAIATDPYFIQYHIS